MKNDLIQLYKRNKEGARGYSFAEQKIKNKNFKTFLSAYAQRREAFASQLETIMEEHGIDPPNGTSVLGDLHMTFVKVLEALSGNADSAILKECARGESMALSDYQKVLKNENFPPKVLKMLMHQRNVIMAAEKTMRELAPILDSGT